MSHRKESRSSQDLIDINLKQIFQETVDEDVPDRFRDLIDRLRTQETEEKQEGEEDK